VFETCPTDVVEAPVEVVWQQITEPSHLEGWVGGPLVSTPTRAATKGDVLDFRTGPFGATVRFIIGEPKPMTELPVRIEIFLGIVNEKVVRITPTNPGRCRVTFQ
jgi:hypothetical protein